MLSPIIKCKTIIKIIKKHGERLGDKNSFDYWGVIISKQNERWHIILPFILNVSFFINNMGKENKVIFHAGDEHILEYLFNKLSPLADK